MVSEPKNFVQQIAFSISSSLSDPVNVRPFSHCCFDWYESVTTVVRIHIYLSIVF